MDKTNGAILVGFDSAWTDNAKAPGAICSVLFGSDRFVDFQPPELIGFQQALAYINALQRSDMPTLVALDQPTLVPNDAGMRPVEKVAASLISWMGGGVQPANRGKLAMFGPKAPIWDFLEKLAATENPEDARTAVRGLHLMEVFPALALASLEARFFGRLMGPRYNPGRRRTFKIEDWRAVIAAASAEAKRFGCDALVAWLDELRNLEKPKKADQDRLDAALCLLIAIRWRFGARNESVAIGDLQTGYIVTPVSSAVMTVLLKAADERKIPVNLLGKPKDVLSEGDRARSGAAGGIDYN
jgi:predicted RNase H-like nuclease